MGYRGEGLGHPFFLRWGHEMNSDRFPWSEDANGNRRGEFVQAWRHIHDIFTSVGASNVSWVWCPNVESARFDLAGVRRRCIPATTTSTGRVWMATTGVRPGGRVG